MSSSLLLRSAAQQSRRSMAMATTASHHYRQSFFVAQNARRTYSSTVTLWDKNKADDGADAHADNNIISNNNQKIITTTGNIQTMNMDITEEEALKILEEELALIAQEEAGKVNDLWEPGQRKRPLQSAKRLEQFDDETWTLRDKRCGGLAIKLGMMPVWDDWGDRHPCTVLFMDSNIVTGHKTMEQHGYRAVQVGAGERKKKNVKTTVLNQYKDIPQVQEHPPYIIREFRITDDACYPPIGTSLHARHFLPGQNIDIAGISKGKGFQGAMKRHGFAGMPASHGVSKSHRALGSTGMCQDPGKVFKGKKMAGRMGTDRVTIQNLRIVKIDRGRNLIYVRGAVPGNKGSFVEIRDAIKKPLWGTPKVLASPSSDNDDNADDSDPTANAKPPIPTFDYDPSLDGTGQAGYEEFMPLADQDPLAPLQELAA